MVRKPRHVLSTNFRALAILETQHVLSEVCIHQTYVIYFKICRFIIKNYNITEIMVEIDEN